MAVTHAAAAKRSCTPAEGQTAFPIKPPGGESESMFGIFHLPPLLSPHPMITQNVGSVLLIESCHPDIGGLPHKDLESFRPCPPNFHHMLASYAVSST